MFANYTTKEVLRPVTQEVIKSFTFQIPMPVEVVREIVERNFVSTGNYGRAGFNKITAIKELRELGTIRSNGANCCVSLGLREAKEMIEEVYREGEQDGNYHATTPTGWVDNLDDGLPF